MSMNSNYQPKRKGRIPPGRGKPNKPAIDKALLNDGVYCNARLTHVATSLIGSKVQVHVKNGGLYEGIFKTFSSKMDIVLELAHKIDESNPDQPPTKDCLLEKVIFNLNDVVMLSAIGTELDYATKDATKKDADGFTDSAISKFNGQVAEKELQPWEGDNPSLDGELEAGGTSTAAAAAPTTTASSSANGWDAEEMFKENADKFNVKSSYDPTLTAYTTPLDKKDTKEFREREAQAARLAHEIEGTEGYRNRLDLENGDGDEEMKYSAVVRPDKDGSGPGGKYVPPHLRKPVPKGPVPARSGGKPAAQGVPNKASGQPQGGHVSSADNSAESKGEKSEHVEEAGTGGDTVASNSDSNPNPPPKSDKDNPAPVSVSVAGKADMSKKPGAKPGRDAQIKELKEFSSTFRLGHDSESKKGTSEATPPPNVVVSSNQVKSSTEAAHLGTQSSSVRTTPPISSDKGSKPSDKKEKEHAESLAEKVKKSKLNPMAREFTLNPTAKPFVPRQQPMQIATPPRPTPQSPQGMMHQQMPHHLAQGQGYPGMQPAYQVVPVQVSASAMVQQQQRFTNATAGKRVTVSVQRPEFNPAVQAAAVQAATGQPLLAQNLQSVQGQHQFVPQYMSQHVVAQAGGMQQVYPQMVPMGPGARMVTPPVVPTSHSNEQSQQGAPQTQVFVPHPGGPQVAPQLGGPGAAGQQPHPSAHNAPAHHAPHLHSTPPQSQQSHMASGQSQGGPGGHPTPSPVPQGHPSAGHQQPGGHPPTSGTPQPHSVMVYQPGTPQMHQQGHPPLQPSPHTPTSPQTMYPPGVAYSLPYSHSHQGQQIQAAQQQPQGVSYAQVQPNTSVTQAHSHQHIHMPQIVMMPQHHSGGHTQMQHGGPGGGPPQQYPPHLQGHHAAMQGHHIQGVPGQAGPTMVPQASMNMSSGGVPPMYMPPQIPSQGPPPMQAYPHSQ